MQNILRYLTPEILAWQSVSTRKGLSAQPAPGNGMNLMAFSRRKSVR